MRDIPSTLIVYDPIVLEEVPGRWSREQELEVVIGILTSKCSSDESVDEDGGGICRRNELRCR